MKDVTECDESIQIYKACITAEESKTGLASGRPLEVNFQQALEYQEARTVFIRRKYISALIALGLI
jgi:hypothetical protein